MSHILQDCPLLDQLSRTTRPEGETVRQKLWGMGCLGELQMTVPVCLVLGTASVTAIEKKKKKKKKEEID